MLHRYHMAYAVSLHNYILTTNDLLKDFLSKLVPSMDGGGGNAKQIATNFKNPNLVHNL